MTVPRLYLLVAAVAIVATACTATSSSTTGAGTSTSTTNATEVPSGQLLILDPEGMIRITSDDGTEVEVIKPATGFRYTQPIWTTSKTIIATELSPTENYITASEVGGEQLWRTGFTTPPFYYIATPGDGAPTVLSLRNNDTSPGLIAEAIDSKGSVQAIGDEAPFYMTWDPSGDRFATHVGAARVDVGFDPATTILETTAMFQAPIWLDDGLALLRSSGSDTFLSLWDGEVFKDLGIVRGAARFVGRGNRIAIQTGAGIDTGGVQANTHIVPTIPAGTLTIVDTQTGEFTTVTPDSSAIFQWDPSGNRLLYATLRVDPTPALVWHVWEEARTIDFEPFGPDPFWFQTVVPFFDQYAQSVSMWSPNGAAFAFPAVVDGITSILVQDLTESEPSLITSGSWVAWSPAE